VKNDFSKKLILRLFKRDFIGKVSPMRAVKRIDNSKETKEASRVIMSEINKLSKFKDNLA